MQPPIHNWRRVCRSTASAPYLILTGLILIGCGVSWPGVPVVTAVALVGLGAVLATVERCQSSRSCGTLLVAQLAIYGNLYVLFLGATFHAASTPGNSLTPLATADLAVSIWPMLAAVALVVETLRNARTA